MVYQNSYRWRNGSSYSVKAQDAGEYLEKMSNASNGITAEQVLDASRAEGALLHPCFEWDDRAAAEKFRLKQAGKLIGDLVCVAVGKTETGEKTVATVQAFCNTELKRYGQIAVYKPFTVALGNADDRKFVLENARRDALIFAKKYETLSEFAGVIAEIRKAVK